jgi:hypothetical protein
MRRFVLAAIAAAGLASASPALAQYGAIAYDTANCAWGDSWNFPNQAAADQKALAECKHPGCKVMTQIGPHQCGALAATPDCHGWGWATRPSRAAAELGAMQECQGHNAGQCAVKLGDCDR